MSKKIMLSGVQPTRAITLGNYLGAIKNWVKLQKEYQCYFMSVDLHAITLKQDPKELRDATYYGIATYLAAGIHPKTCNMFVQSHVSEHAELGWVLTCYSTMGELNRMTQFKDKSGKQGDHIPTGLFTYPALMAADILLYDSNAVPVGADQKQHIELTRDIAIRMNNLYGKDTFVIPEPYIAPVGAKIMSLLDPESKMSKSDVNANASVFLTDSEDTIRKKIKRAVTDSGSEITADTKQSGVHNLLTIQSCILGKSIQELADSYAGKQYGHLKVETGDIVAAAINPIRTEIEKLMGDLGYLNELLKKGAENARERASKTLARVYDRLGFIPR
ncbi:MAG: tryptophan--tRNA ligase [Xanthomonadaceae bacterium]|nr:tryptophan--tRNA ligase [Xanthomonadaceae bacterium]